jgi:hypothetical protein
MEFQNVKCPQPKIYHIKRVNITFIKKLCFNMFIWTSNINWGGSIPSGSGYTGKASSHSSDTSLQPCQSKYVKTVTLIKGWALDFMNLKPGQKIYGNDIKNIVYSLIRDSAYEFRMNGSCTHPSASLDSIRHSIVTQTIQ